MDICVLNLVTFVFIGTNAAVLPLESTNSTELPVIRIETMRQMGRGLQSIPVGFPEVKTLNLAYNHISRLSSHVFTNKSYRALQTIDLQENKITNISTNAFRGLRQLKEVDLSDNNITNLDTYTFRYNNKLEKVDLSNNMINFRRLQVFLMSTSIETLIITHNSIEQIYELTFMGLTNLKTLMLDHNTLLVIAADSFKSLARLQYLSLSNTGVYRLSQSMFPSEDLPRIIDIENTPLAAKFDPHLTKVKDNAVRNLLNLDEYIYITEDAA